MCYLVRLNLSKFAKELMHMIVTIVAAVRTSYKLVQVPHLSHLNQLAPPSSVVAGPVVLLTLLLDHRGSGPDYLLVP